MNQRDTDDYLAQFQLTRWEGREFNWLTWASLSVCQSQKLNPLRIINPVLFPLCLPLAPVPHHTPIMGIANKQACDSEGQPGQGSLLCNTWPGGSANLPRNTAPGWCGCLHGKSSLNIWPGLPQILSQPFLATLGSSLAGWGREERPGGGGGGGEWVGLQNINECNLCLFPDPAWPAALVWNSTFHCSPSKKTELALFSLRNCLCRLV